MIGDGFKSLHPITFILNLLVEMTMINFVRKNPPNDSLSADITRGISISYSTILTCAPNSYPYSYLVKTNSFQNFTLNSLSSRAKLLPEPIP